MKRDIIDCLMAGGLLSFMQIWITDGPEDRIVITIGIAVIIYIFILAFRKEEHHGSKQV